MTDRNATDRPNSTPGQAPTFTDRLDTHLTTELKEAQRFLHEQGTATILDRFTFANDEVHFDTDGMPRLLVTLFADFIRGIALMTDDEADQVRAVGPREGLGLVRQALVERGSR